MKRDTIEDGAASRICKTNVVEGDIAVNGLERDHAARIFIFLCLRQDLAGAFEPGKRFGDLRTDSGDLENRRDQKSEECRVGKILAERHGAGEDLARSEIHDDAANNADQHTRGKPEDGSGGESLQDVIEQALHTSSEDG